MNHLEFEAISNFFSSPFHNAYSSQGLYRIKYFPEPKTHCVPMGRHVGELQELWQLPSDHLPIGLTMRGFHIASWNVLHAKWVMNWSYAQGLNRSMILREHIYIKPTELTLRDCHVIQLLLAMIVHPTHPRSILCLQECSEPFLEELQSRLPDRFALAAKHAEAIVYDQTKLRLLEIKETAGVFADEPKRTFLDLHFNSAEKRIRLINVHLPGDLDGPGRYEFTNYLASTFHPAMTTLAMGDMNFNELELAEAMQSAFLERSPFTIYSPYCTNIAPCALVAKAIDHFIVYAQDSIRISEPEEILPGLSSMARLLNGP